MKTLIIYDSLYQGYNQIAESEGFIVEGKEGPLRIGEVERAKNWAETIFKK